MKTHKLTWTALICLFSVSICIAQKKHEFSYYDSSPVVEPGATFIYHVEQKADGYTVQIGDRKYSITTTVKSKTSQKPEQMLLKGKFNNKAVRGYLDYAYGGLVADYMTIVPGVGIVGWNEAWKKYAVWDYGHAGAGRVQWLIRADGVAQFARRGEFVARADTRMHGLLAKKILYTYSYPQNKAVDVLKSPDFQYPARAFLMQDNKIEKTWNRLLCLSTDDRRSLFIDFYENEYIQLAQYQDPGLATVTTLDQKLNTVSEYRDVVRVLESPQKIRMSMDHFFGFRVERLVSHEEIPGMYRILDKKGQLTVPDSTWGVIPLTTRYENRNSPASRFTINNKWFDDASVSPNIMILHQYLLPYPQDNGDLHWGMMEDVSGKGKTGPVWQDWYVDESEEIRAKRKFTQASPRIFLAQDHSQKWKPYNLFMYPQKIDQLTQVTDIMEQAEPVTALEEAITNIENALVRLEEKMDSEFHHARQAHRDRQQAQWIANQRLQKEAAAYNQERIAEQQARHRQQTGNTTSSSSSSGITHSQQAKDSYNQTVRQSQERQSMRDYKRELDAKIRSVTR